MASQNGTVITPPNVIVNKAAKRIVIERKIPKEESLERKVDNRNDNSISTSAVSVDVSIVNDDVEDGEIDEDVPSTSFTKQRIVENDGLDQKNSTNGPVAQNGEGESVQRKMTALERLKSLSFAMPKSTVNPFTVTTPKPATSAAAYDLKPDRREGRNSHHAKNKEFDGPEIQGNMMRQYEHSRRGGRREESFAGSFRSPEFKRFRRPDRFPLREDELQFRPIELQRPVRFPSIGEQWQAPNEYPSDRIPREEHCYSPSRFGPSELLPTVTADAVPEERPNLPPTPSIRWEAVRQLNLPADELNSYSPVDLRSVVQYLLEEESELINVHHRLQDQMKNVRRALDREKQIEQLKKQAMAAVATSQDSAQQTQSTFTPNKKKRRVPLSSKFDGDLKMEPGCSLEQQPMESRSKNRMGFDDAFAQALKRSICEHADARKAHMAQYVSGPSMEYAAGTSTGVQLDRSGRSASYPDGQQPSTSLPKEKFLSMFRSFFEGVSSMTDRSLFQETSDV